MTDTYEESLAKFKAVLAAKGSNRVVEEFQEYKDDSGVYIPESTLFQQIAAQHIKCEICGADTIALYGGGWDNDRIYCSDRDCGAEYVFATSTEGKESYTNESQD